MTAVVDETTPPLDDLFRDLLAEIADECGVTPLPAPQQLAAPLRHSSDTDLHPVIEVLAAALSARPVRRRCLGVPGVPCGRRTHRVNAARRCPRCQRRWLRRARADRIEEYTELTREHHLSQRAAAERVGVCLRTATRYEADLRLAEVAAVDRRPESAYDLIAPDADDVGWEWLNELAAELGDGPVRVLWQCQELTDRRDQAAPPQAGDVAA